MAEVLSSLQTSITSNITTILPVAGAIFALMFGVGLIPKLIKKFQ